MSKQCISFLLLVKSSLLLCCLWLSLPLVKTSFEAELIVFIRQLKKVAKHRTSQKYKFVETPRKFNVAKLSIRKLGSSSVLIIIH